MGYVDGLIDYLVQIAYGVLMAILYPISSLIKIVVNVIVYIWDTFTGLINGVYGIFDTFYEYVTGLLNLSFPVAWVAVIGIGLLLAVTLRVYYFLRDIEIGGFKI